MSHAGIRIGSLAVKCIQTVEEFFRGSPKSLNFEVILMLCCIYWVEVMRLTVLATATSPSSKFRGFKIKYPSYSSRKTSFGSCQFVDLILSVLFLGESCENANTQDCCTEDQTKSHSTSTIRQPSPKEGPDALAQPECHGECS